MTTTKQNTEAVIDLFHSQAVVDRANLLFQIAEGRHDRRRTFDTAAAQSAAWEANMEAHRALGMALYRFSVALGIDLDAVDAEVKSRIRNKDHAEALGTMEVHA